MKKTIRSFALAVLVIFLVPYLVSADSNIFSWPADGVVTSKFGDSRDHKGIDIAKRGSSVPITSTYEGRVSRSQWMNGYGNVVTVEHDINGQTVETLYAHMKERHVSVGDWVSQGKRLGYMGNTGDSTGQHLHFEVHFGLWNGSKSNAVDPLKVLNGDYDDRFGDLEKYKVYHSTKGLLKTFNSYQSAKAYSLKWNNTAVIRESDGKQLYENGLNSGNYTVYHSVHKALASFSIKQNAINYSNRWQHTVVRDNATRKEVYARSDLGDTRYEVFHSSQGVIDVFHFDYLARAQSNYYKHTIVIDKSTGKQVYKHPDANDPQYEVYHSKHGTLASFSYLSAAKKYSNNWQNTVVFNTKTRQQVYAHPDLGETNFEVFHTSQGVLGEFHYAYLARGLSNMYQNTIVIDKSTGKQAYKHPDANEKQYEIFHSKHGKLATFSFLSAAKRYSNDWQNTVVIDNITKKEMYAREDLGDFRFAVKNNQGEVLSKFHLLMNAEDFAAKYSSGSVVIEDL